MKKYSIYFSLFLAVIFTFSSCQNELIEEPNTLDSENTSALDRESIALNVVNILQNPSTKDQLTSLLSGKPVGVSLENALHELSINSTALRQSVTASKNLYEGQELPEHIEIPELWMHEPKGADLSQLLVSFAPKGDEKSWDKIKAFNLKGEVVYLDPIEAPNVPVIVVETNGFEALKVEAKFMNKMFRDAGLQSDHSVRNPAIISGKTANNGLETTKLDKIRLKDDQEPWISGAAEVYAITSGIKNSSNEPEIQVIPMYYLDHDGRDYYPNQVLLFWDDYAYQAANIQLFEKDDNQNYQALAGAIVNGVFQIIGTVSGQPWVNVLGQVANAILEAMPSNWFTNDDDYVDSFYTIEKNRTYTNYYGAAGNAKVNMSPYFIPAN
ncbi:MAG: DUF3103 family protein [Flammeovirgaceae bacterium]